LVVTASLLDIQHLRDSVKNKPASSLAPLGKALTGFLYLWMIWQVVTGGSGGVDRLTERRQSNRKVTKTLVRTLCDSASLYPWFDSCHIEVKQSTYRGGPASQKTANRNVPSWEWYDRHLA